MKLGRTLSGALGLLAAAALGLLLVLLPNWLVRQYHLVQQIGPFWATLYALVVGAGLILLSGSSGYLIWRLWGRSLAKRLRRERRNRPPSQMSADQMAGEVAENLELVQQLGEQDRSGQLAGELDAAARQLDVKRQQQTLEIVAFGTISSGKSAVLNALAGRDLFATDVRGGTTTCRAEVPWQRLDRVVLVDTPGLGEIDGAPHVESAAQAARDADLVLLVVDGPLRASEHGLLERLAEMEKRIVICLNKSDWYTPDDRQKLLGQLVRQAAGAVSAEDVVSIQAEAGLRRRKRIAADGSEVVEEVATPPDIEPLARRMVSIIQHQGKQLISANLLLQSRGLVESARHKVRQTLDEQAWGVVDRYMWGSGGAAAIIPFPVVDLLAGVGLSTKMILDLAAIYQQPVDLETARRWLGEMGKNLVGVLGVQAAAPAVASVVASLLKTLPGAGTIAGGALQGAVQALITRWIGGTFIEYFRNEMQMPEGGLPGLARRQWTEVTRAESLGRLVREARQRLTAGAER